MNKRIILTFIALAVVLVSSAAPTDVVGRFTDAMTQWVNNGNIAYGLEGVESQVTVKPAFKAADQLMQELALRNGLIRTNDYLFPNFITCWQSEIDKGAKVTFRNITDISPTLLDPKYRNRDDIRFVRAEVAVEGPIQYSGPQLYYVTGTKIAKIGPYEEYVDAKTGKRRVRLDMSGIEIDEEQQSLGLTYEYSKHFAYGGSLSFSYWKFMISADFGIHSRNDVYTTRKVDFTDIMNYKVTEGKYKPKYYLTFTPAFYMKYFSIGWGFGYLNLDGGTTSYGESTTGSGNNLAHVTTSGSSDGDSLTKFMMRPVVRGYIPVSDNIFITLSVSYNWVLGYKECNGIGFGAGINWWLDL